MDVPPNPSTSLVPTSSSLSTHQEPPSTGTAGAHAESSGDFASALVHVARPRDSLPVHNGPKGARHIQPKNAPRGRRTTWPPKKLAWLQSHVSQFLQAKDASAFYDRVIFLWYRIFGRTLALRDDPDFDINEDAALLREDPEQELTEDEKAVRVREEQELRTVRLSPDVSAIYPKLIVCLAAGDQ